MVIEDPDRPGWVLVTQKDLDSLLNDSLVRHWKRPLVGFLVGSIGSAIIIHILTGGRVW